MFSSVLKWFSPPPAIPRKTQEEIERLYPLYRWRVFEAAFVAYAMFYVVRNNLAPVQMEVGQALGYDKSMLGSILAGTAIAYGIGKLVMGYFADHSDSRKYLFVGMSLTGLLNFAFATAESYSLHFFLWTLNGFVQGMGYGPCTRGLAHWYSVKERGVVFGFWNISHNVGGAIAGIIAAWCAQHYGWKSAFYVPGAMALICGVYLFLRMRDTPQSVGLPPIEEFKNEYPPEEKVAHEKELSFREMFFEYILPNKMLWIVALANFFVYVARYSMVDWGPTYLKEVKGASLMMGGMSTAMIEITGAFGMLAMGWVSDRLGGRRGMVSALTMIPLILAFWGIIAAPASMLWLDMILFGVIGFFVYVPVMMLGVMSLDLTSKKAVGTAAGFVGLFGYLGRVAQAKGLGWMALHYGWEVGLYGVLACTFAGFVLLLFAWNVRPRG